jgi:N-acetylglucosamine-6-phosphate deacetylase
MTGPLSALRAPLIHDGAEWHRDAAVVMQGGTIRAVASPSDIPAGTAVQDLGGGMLVPGYVDLQVNGGDGLMLNDAPEPETLRRMAQAHARLGATSILPTLITDTPEVTAAAVAAVCAAVAESVPGIIGLHLEGPHLDPRRKGAHDPALIRPMQRQDLDALLAAAHALPVLMVTLAPEAADHGQIAALTRAGAVVSLGHTDADFATCRAAFDAGARCVTHLFNAMRQLGNREPGVVGAALADGRVSAGLIADGIHVHPAAMGAALRAKAGPGEVFLVSDAMAVAGTDLDGFRLNGRRIGRRDGRLTLADGTLAGADLDLTTALRVLCRDVGLPLGHALRMATAVPARVAGRGGHIGALVPGARADLVHLVDAADGAGPVLAGVWRGGAPVRRD